MSLARVASSVALVLAAMLSAGCGDAPSAAASAPSAPSAGAYPSGPYRIAMGGTLPDATFDGIRADGTRAAVSFREYYEPEARAARLLVLRVHGGAWCGTCLWHAAHGRETTEGRLGARLALVDLVVRGPDGATVTTEDLAAFRALVDGKEAVPTLADPTFFLRAIAPESGAPLPLFVFVDRRTMTVVGHATNPTPDALADQIASLLAEADGVTPPPASASSLVDGRFHRNEWDLVAAMGEKEPLPPDPTNAVADDPSAAALGAALFEEKGFSNKGVSCATCHDPARGFSDGLPVPSGIVHGTRKTPSIRLAAYARHQHWDGRFDRAWTQALAPLENADEIGSSRIEVVRRLVASHRAAYEAAFPRAALPDPSRLPERGKPGDAAYDALPADTKDVVTRVFVDAGKAIAAYERTFVYPRIRLDRYARGDFTALSSAEKAGLATFLDAGCVQCHFGPRLTDDAFHTTRARDGATPDRGRADALVAAAVWSTELGPASRFSDARMPPPRLVVPDASTIGAFKTPSLRLVAAGGPYGHAGTMAKLVDVTEHYGQGGVSADDSGATGALEPWLPVFDEAAQWALVPFLASLREE